MASSGNHKILVADDSVTIQKVIRLALSNENYEIHAVSDGKDAEQQIPLSRPDVVLIDHALPNKTAFQIREEFLKEEPESQIKFVLMSSAFENVEEEKVSSLQFHGRLVKPFDPSHLRQVLVDVLGEPEPVVESAASSIQPPVQPPPAPSVSAPPPAPVDVSAVETPPAPVTQDKAPPADDLWTEGGVTTQTIELSQDTSAGMEIESVDPLSEPVNNGSHAEEAVPTENGREDDDIKSLTESTVKMSGLDNFEWSVNEQSILKENKPKPSVATDDAIEHIRKVEPDLPPQNKAGDMEDVSFHVDPFPSETPKISKPSKEIQTNLNEIPESFFNKKNIPTSIAPDPEDTTSVGDQVEEITVPDSGPGVPQISSEEPQVAAVTTEQMEQILKNQLRETVEKTVRQALPDIAEKVIREEIHKLLSNPP